MTGKDLVLAASSALGAFYRCACSQSKGIYCSGTLDGCQFAGGLL